MTLARIPRRFIAIAIATPLALLAIGSPRDAQAQRDRTRFGSEYRSRIDTTFAFDKTGSINVTVGSGDIVVTGWSRDQIHVRAVSDNNNVRLDASSSRMTLEVAGGSRGSDTRFEVSVPYGVHVAVRAMSGDISVRGTRGEVEAHAQSGDIEVEDVTSRLDVNTLSGGIEAHNVSGDVEIGTTSGDVKVTDLRGNVEIGTVSGDVELRGVTAKQVRAKTTSGDVTFDGLIDPAGRYERAAHRRNVERRRDQRVSDHAQAGRARHRLGQCETIHIRDWRRCGAHQRRDVQRRHHDFLQRTRRQRAPITRTFRIRS
jgi:hypothetical protein